MISDSIITTPPQIFHGSSREPPTKRRRADNLEQMLLEKEIRVETETAKKINGVGKNEIALEIQLLRQQLNRPSPLFLFIYIFREASGPMWFGCTIYCFRIDIAM